MCLVPEGARTLVLSAIYQAEGNNVEQPEKLDAALLLIKNIHYYLKVL